MLLDDGLFLSNHLLQSDTIITELLCRIVHSFQMIRCFLDHVDVVLRYLPEGFLQLWDGCGHLRSSSRDCLEDGSLELVGLDHLHLRLLLLIKRVDPHLVLVLNRPSVVCCKQRLISIVEV